MQRILRQARSELVALHTEVCSFAQKEGPSNIVQHLNELFASLYHSLDSFSGNAIRVRVTQISTILHIIRNNSTSSPNPSPEPDIRHCQTENLVRVTYALPEDIQTFQFAESVREELDIQWPGLDADVSVKRGDNEWLLVVTIPGHIDPAASARSRLPDAAAARA